MWARGAGGEERVAQLLAKHLDPSVVVLHDRAIARSRANIDHIAIAGSGVWVIDAKRYKGKVAVSKPLRRFDASLGVEGMAEGGGIPSGEAFGEPTVVRSANDSWLKNGYLRQCLFPACSRRLLRGEPQRLGDRRKRQLAAPF